MSYLPAQPYAYPNPPLPPPRRSNRVVVLLVLGICVALLVCGGLGATAYLFSRHPATDDGDSVAAPSTEHPGDLRGYLVAAPAKSRPWTNPPGTDGHLSLDQAAAESTDPTARGARLRRDNFQEGAVRTWHASDNTLVEIRLLRFGDDDSASDFYQADAAGTAKRYDTAHIITVDGVGEGVVIPDPARDANGYVHLIGLARNGDVVLVVSVSQHGNLAPAAAEQLVKAQYDRL